MAHEPIGSTDGRMPRSKKNRVPIRRLDVVGLSPRLSSEEDFDVL